MATALNSIRNVQNDEGKVEAGRGPVPKADSFMTSSIASMTERTSTIEMIKSFIAKGEYKAAVELADLALSIERNYDIRETIDRLLSQALKKLGKKL